MPLRVAEKDGYIYGVSKCYDCPFAEHLKSDDRAIRIGPFWECGNADADANAGMEVIGVGIPVWCPLPSPLDIWLYGSPKTATEASILERNKMRGKHPENIVWDAEPIQPVFIVENAESDKAGYYITIKPEFSNSPDWTYIRKDDMIVIGDEKKSYRWWDIYRVIETPVSSRVRITTGKEPKKGERMALLGPNRGKET